ncbi:MAG: hypothetical protein RIS51_401, partial [Actinomycetota bacterium]
VFLLIQWPLEQMPDWLVKTKPTITSFSKFFFVELAFLNHQLL